MFSRYNSPGLAGMARSEPFHGKKLSCLVGCKGQVDRVPREGVLPCVVHKCFNAFSKQTYEKLDLPG